MPARILGLGTIVVDQLMMLDAHPQTDTKHEAHSALMQVGGPVPTALAQLRRFGRECTFVGRWGDDPFGDVIEADLRREGITFSPNCRMADGASGFAHVWIDAFTGERTLVYRRPSGAATSIVLDPAELAGIDALHLDGWPQEAALEAARIVQENGGTVFLDAGTPKPGTAELLRYVDVMTAPRRFAEEFLGCDDLRQAAVRLQTMGPRIVAITDGEQGAVMVSEAGLIDEGALQVDAVDTNGAGDVFAAGVIEAVLRKWDGADIFRFATIAAGLKCRRLGNRDALASLEEIAGRFDRSL